MPDSPRPESRHVSLKAFDSENDINLNSAPLPVQKLAQNTSLTFNNLLNTPLILHEDPHPGCGGHLWPAGMVLAKYMLSHHADLRGAKVIEIGAGG